ncbi:MAG: alpha/beta fold hydrolase [Bdellovibrio sp.]|nr:alpha/beta fold hydrolase [Bdellovibrio sp.]
MCGVVYPELVRGFAESKVDWKSDISFISAMQSRERFGQVKSYFAKNWDTQIFYSNTAVPNVKGESPLVDPNSKAVIIFFHGSGTMKSSGGNFISNMNSMANLGFSSISMDMPFHGQGPRDTKFNDSKYFMEWIRSIVLEAKKSGKPVYLAGHSFGPDVALEYAARYPKDIAGVTGLSPAGFTKELEKWYDEHTSKMKFGGNVAENDAGGKWAYHMSKQFLWSKGKLADPTLVNPKLNIRILSGNREEYVPGPVDGENGTPIGDNTYDISIPLKKVLRNATVTIEPGIGHYLFDAVDKDGYNVAQREFLLTLGEHPANIKKIQQETQIENAKIHFPGQLAKRYSQDALFRGWADATYGQGKVIKLAAQGMDALAQKVLDTYNIEQKARELEIFKKILDTKTTHPDFYEKYKTQLDRMNPKSAEASMFPAYLNEVLKKVDSAAK